MAKTPKNEVAEAEPEQATVAVEEYRPVADFVAHVTPIKPESRISNLTRASHANWRRQFRLLRGMGRLPR